MGRKVFISILGSSDYKQCKYIEPESNFISKEVRFVQEATLEYHNAKQWPNNSLVFICLTKGNKGSKMTNWKDNGHYDKKSLKQIICDGLEKRLKNMALPFKIKTISIKDGNDEKEIWAVFDSIFNVLLDEDEVYFDITHGFRYLPMLALVIANFTKFTKGINVKSIMYGNYEGRNLEKNEAPLIELRLFSELQDWSSATQAFLETGNTIRIKNLLIESNDNSFSAEDLICLENFYYEIFEVRGLKIIEGNSVMRAVQILENVKTHTTPFKLLQSNLLSHFKSFKPKCIDNLFEAVCYCQKFNMVQQGITLFLEYLICKVLFDIKENFNDFEKRKIAGGALSINKVEAFDYSDFIDKIDNENDKIIRKTNIETTVRKIFELSYKKKLSDKVFKGLSLSTRHDINHAGFRDKPLEIKVLGEKLESYIERFKELKEQLCL